MSETTRHPDPCPSCGGDLVLRPSRHGPFFGCVRWPQCKGSAGAHADGRPLGRAADQATKYARRCAHEVFDRLWRGDGAIFATRGKAYRWLANAMQRDVVHMAELDGDECVRVCALAAARLESGDGWLPSLARSLRFAGRR